jgi:uroporphyrin-III C-methyltransferase/precorrin-2 dehydrogenase/sirohydrochlorin ferrochelatase
MDFLPIFLDIKNRPCLVVGGGEVASRKVYLLLKAGAEVTVVAPELCGLLEKHLTQDDFVYKQAEFTPEDLGGQCLVIAATNSQSVNKEISELATAQNIFVNVVDSPELCSFTMPSIIDRSPIMVAVSSGGASPVLARLLRARLETLIPASYGRLAALVKTFRETVKQRFKTSVERRRFWENILQGPIAEMMFSGQEKQARLSLEKAIDEGSERISSEGEVYLVGAGPGDPDLVTFRALRLLQQADVIVYDRLVSKEILELARRDAEQIYVGKERDFHSLPQEDINHLLARLAKEGKRVLRLKGGDPFIFGRGGEEIDTLAAEGVNFQVVPGITAAAGCSSYAGIPLTHRDYAQSVIFVTGHLKDGSINLNWNVLSQADQTVVFYMGLKGVKTICEQLVAHGAPGDRPVALVQKGTQQSQKVFIGTLETMPGIVDNSNIEPPTIIIVGNVVNLHKTLSWFEPVPNAS